MTMDKSSSNNKQTMDAGRLVARETPLNNSRDHERLLAPFQHSTRVGSLTDWQHRVSFPNRRRCARKRVRVPGDSPVFLHVISNTVCLHYCIQLMQKARRSIAKVRCHEHYKCKGVRVQQRGNGGIQWRLVNP